VSAFVEDLLPYLATTYDVIIGHSVGGAVTMSLFPFLPSTKETTVILVDPIVEVPDAALVTNTNMFLEEIENPKSADEWMAENPSWSRRDCMLRAHGISMCTGAVVKDLIQVGIRA